LLVLRKSLAAASGLLISALATPSLAQPAACQLPTAAPPAHVVQVVEPAPPIPVKPACMERGTCRDAEVKSYNAVVDAYNQAAKARGDRHNAEVARGNDYIAAMNAYLRTVNAYAQCEVDRITVIVNAQRTPDRPKPAGL